MSETAKELPTLRIAPREGDIPMQLACPVCGPDDISTFRAEGMVYTTHQLIETSIGKWQVSDYYEEGDEEYDEVLDVRCGTRFAIGGDDYDDEPDLWPGEGK